MGKQVELLEHHPDLALNGVNIAQVVGQFDAIHDDVAPLMFLQAIDGADEGGLAAP